MSDAFDYPSVSTLHQVIRPSDYDEFRAGWRDGTIHRATAPIASEVIEDLALLLDSSAQVERIKPQE